MESYESVLRGISAAAEKIVRLCSEKGCKVSCAESCTGGMLSAAITSVSGSSRVIELGVCAYSNRIKERMLSVSGKTLEAFTEYSAECAEEMARGVMNAAGADFGVSTTGVAGPSGGTEKAPVGTVYIGVCDARGGRSRCFHFESAGGEGFTPRDYIRAAAAKQALELLLEQIENY